MLRRRFLSTVPFWISAGAWAAGAGDDPRFPASIASMIGGKSTRLVLTGSALRKKYGFSVYTVASYLQEGAGRCTAPRL